MTRFHHLLITVLFIFPTLCSAAALPLQGAGIYQRLQNDVYLARVYHTSGEPQHWLQAAQPLRLEIQLLAEDWSQRRFYRLWNEGLAINLSEQQLQQHLTDISRFSRAPRGELLQGDVLVISNETGNTLVSLNQQPLLTLDNPDFVRLLLATWIGKFPQSPGLRNDLLAADVSQREQLLARYPQPIVNPGRQQQIRDWFQLPAEASLPAVAQSTVAAPVVARSVVTEPEPAVTKPVVAALTSSVNKTQQARQADKIRQQQQRQARLQAEAERLQQQQAEQEALEARRIQAQARYYRQLLRQANSQVQYPQRAMRRRQQGTVRVSLALTPSGELVSSVVSESSDIQLLDRAALAAAQRAQPYPALPDILAADGPLEFDIPFKFVLVN
ncbi:TonB family protein [Bacterioplanoides pacificum]|uniref:TonB family protein n=1 Tax=Bacterioplanoides pacificum TaxID=1171596 RepID=A0ABV7VQ75_9GAMM